MNNSNQMDKLCLLIQFIINNIELMYGMPNTSEVTSIFVDNQKFVVDNQKFVVDN